MIDRALDLLVEIDYYAKDIDTTDIRSLAFVRTDLEIIKNNLAGKHSVFIHFIDDIVFRLNKIIFSNIEDSEKSFSVILDMVKQLIDILKNNKNPEKYLSISTLAA